MQDRIKGGGGVLPDRASAEGGDHVPSGSCKKDLIRRKEDVGKRKEDVKISNNKIR